MSHYAPMSASSPYKDEGPRTRRSPGSSYVTRAVSAATQPNKKSSVMTRKRKQSAHSDYEDEFDCGSSSFSDLHRSVSSASLQNRCPTCHGAILDDNRRSLRTSKRQKADPVGDQSPCPRHFKRSNSQDSLDSAHCDVHSASSSHSGEKRKYNRRVQLPPIKMEDSPITNHIYNLIMEQKGKSLDNEMLLHLKLQRHIRHQKTTNRTKLGGNSDSLSACMMGMEAGSWRSSSPTGGQNGCGGKSLNNHNNSGNTTLANTSGYGSETGGGMDTPLFDEASGSQPGYTDLPSATSSFPGDNIKVCQCKCTCSTAQDAIFAKPERRRGNSVGTRAGMQNGATTKVLEQSN
ncbi:hypothetical protein Ciccas_004768 [Cichlidogyrus casuarinus]|uniref:Uncharacterized protein n=1 Tax=Cichlidogyrus casuarinus TaxID=1844966 RepID=A0ABD2QAQ4_9PLAT